MILGAPKFKVRMSPSLLLDAQTELFCVAALLTLRVRDLWAHMKRAPGDIHSRRSLRKLLNQRAKLLRYLKRADRNRYDAVLPRIGVDPRAIEGEIILR